MQYTNGTLSAPYFVVKLDGEEPAQCFSMQALMLFTEISLHSRKMTTDGIRKVLKEARKAGLPEEMTNNDMTLHLAVGALLRKKSRLRLEEEAREDRGRSWSAI